MINMRYEVYSLTVAGTMASYVKFGEAATRKDAVEMRQLCKRTFKDRQVFLYTDGLLDKIGIHLK
jgi:hypothetical protein